MILDTLENASRYTALSPRFGKAFDFLWKADADLKPDRYEIDGENVFARVQKYTTRPVEGSQFEAHRTYIDVQYVLAGRETILWAPLAVLTEVTMPYDEEKDAALFSRVPTATPLRLSAGSFTILYPEDGHGPCCEWDGPCEVLKIVVKVRVDP